MLRRSVLLGIFVASASFLAPDATTADPIVLAEQPDLPPPQIPTSLPVGVTVQWQGEHDLVINWTIHEPGITAAIVGARTADQAAHNAGALKFALTPDEQAEVRRAFDPWSAAAS